MQLSSAEIKIAKQNNSQFVSLKYTGDDGALKQIDTSFNNLKEEKSLVSNHEINLKTIDKKNFIDPFRSLPTTSFFCENIASKYNPRTVAVTLLSKSNEEFKPSLTAEISFWIAETDSQNDYQFIADPIDQYANLRSDIISTLENINIKTTTHFHGSTSGESIIGIRGNDVVDLSDNVIITKFIIANIVDSYGFTVQFTSLDNKITNISLVIQGNGNDMDKLLNAMQRNIEQISYLASADTIYGFELASIHPYKIAASAASNSALKINLICKNLFIPYLAFAELLLYNVDEKILKNEILHYFNEKQIIKTRFIHNETI